MKLKLESAKLTKIRAHDISNKVAYTVSDGMWNRIVWYVKSNRSELRDLKESICEVIKTSVKVL